MSPSSSLKSLTIGRVAEAAGVGVETIRFYERKGLIRRPERNGASFRHYHPEDPTRIRFIKRAQDLGFTLREIKELLELHSRPRTTCGDIREKADSKIEEIEAKIRDLRKMKGSLARLSGACGDGKKALAQCRVLDCFESGFSC